MSRSWLIGEPQRWRMFCDLCFVHDARTFSVAPDLQAFADESWFIGTLVDACPTCVAAGRLPSCDPHPAYRFVPTISPHV